MVKQDKIIVLKIKFKSQINADKQTYDIYFNTMLYH